MLHKGGSSGLGISESSNMPPSNLFDGDLPSLPETNLHGTGLSELQQRDLSSSIFAKIQMQHMPKMEDKVMEPTEFECAVQQPDAEEDELEEMVKQARMKRVIAEIASSKIKPPEPKQIFP